MVTGPRQCGKTTLVRGFTSHGYITLDDDILLEAARGDPSGFVGGLDQAIVDEVQRALDLLRLCKGKNRIVVEYALRDTASRWEWMIDKAPVIEQYRNERQVECIFDANTYQLWIDSDEEPLRSASILARSSGITRVEMLNLEKDCVIIREDPDEYGNRGDLIIKRGPQAAGPQTRPQNQ
jgi:hypothetical protein